MATDFELQVMSELSEIKALAATAAQKAAAANDTAVAASAALTERLFHSDSGVIHTIQSDIKEIKDQAAEDKKWDKIHNVLHYSMTPVIVLGHAIARKLGINV